MIALEMILAKSNKGKSFIRERNKNVQIFKKQTMIMSIEIFDKKKFNQVCMHI
jgi:uncharacterized protein (UPF0128 family)